MSKKFQLPFMSYLTISMIGLTAIFLTLSFLFLAIWYTNQRKIKIQQEQAIYDDYDIPTRLDNKEVIRSMTMEDIYPKALPRQVKFNEERKNKEVQRVLDELKTRLEKTQPVKFSIDDNDSIISFVQSSVCGDKHAVIKHQIETTTTTPSIPVYEEMFAERNERKKVLSRRDRQFKNPPKTKKNINRGNASCKN